MSQQHETIIRFDREISSATTALNQIKQLINQRGNSTPQNKSLISNEQELRTNIAKLKGESIPLLDRLIVEIQRNPLQLNITKQESDRRTNQLTSLKTQFQQYAANAFVMKTGEAYSMRQGQEKLFQGRTEDVEMQDMSSRGLEDQAAYRKQLWNKQEEGLKVAAELTEELIKKQKKVGVLASDGNVIIDDIGVRADQVNQKMLTMQDKFENLLKTTSNNTLWIVIVANIFIMVALIAL